MSSELAFSPVALLQVSVLLALCIGQCLAVEDSRQIVDKAMRAQGGENALSKMKTMRVTMRGTTYYDPGLPVQTTCDAIWQMPERFKSVTEMTMGQGGGKWTHVEIVNGKDGWWGLNGRIKKMHSSKRDAFKGVNIGPIAKVDDKVEFLMERRPRNRNKVELNILNTDKVALVKFYPGQSSDILDYYALKYKGIVLEGSGLGHVSDEWISKLRKHIKQGLVVCMTSQTVFGRVDGFVYSSGRALIDAGVIFLEDMLAETALVKLGFLLGHHGWKGRIKELMLTNMAGELNERLGVESIG